jgi:hypothetical protein
MLDVHIVGQVKTTRPICQNMMTLRRPAMI